VPEESLLPYIAGGAYEKYEHSMVTIPGSIRQQRETQRRIIDVNLTGAEYSRSAIAPAPNYGHQHVFVPARLAVDGSPRHFEKVLAAGYDVIFGMVGHGA
jgi:hypothetical protein